MVQRVIVFDEIEVEVPEINLPWNLIGVIEHFRGEEGKFNYIRYADEEKLNVGKLSTVAPKCEICGSNRFRKITYFTENKETGEIKQVGSSCVEEILSKDLIDTFLSNFNVKEGIRRFIDEEVESLKRSNDFTLSLKEVLMFGIAFINNYGWVSRSKAKENGDLSTSEYVSEIIFGGAPKLYAEIMHDIKDAEEEAEAIIEHFKKLFDELKNIENSYEYNAALICNEGYISPKEIAIAVSLVPSYRAFLDRGKQKEELPESDFVGTIGKREEFVLTLKRRFFFEGAYPYGPTVIHLFKDENNNTVVWKTGYSDLEENVTYKVRCRVKDHSVYRNEKQTLVTHLKVVEEME